MSLDVLVAQALKDRKLSLRKAAKEIGLAHTTVARLVQGESYDVRTLLQVCSWLRVKPCDVLNAEGEVGGPSQVASQLAVFLQLHPGLMAKMEEVLGGQGKNPLRTETVQEILAYLSYRIGLEHQDLPTSSPVAESREA